MLKQFDTYPNGYFNQDDCPTHKSQTEHPGIGATVEVSTLLDIADSFEFLMLVSEKLFYPLLVLVKCLLEGRNGGVVPLVQLGKPFIVDAYFEVALLSLDYGIAYSVNDIVRAPVGSHKCHFR